MFRSQLCFDKAIFVKTIVAAGLVMAGQMLKEGGPQIKGQKPSHLGAFGTALFCIGWIGVAYSTGWRGRYPELRRRSMCVSACVVILGSVLVLQYLKKKYGKCNLPDLANIFLASYVVAWALLGFAVGMGKPRVAVALGIAAPVLAYIGTLGLLPWQRDHLVIDGPGILVLTLGWVCLAVSNAM